MPRDLTEKQRRFVEAYMGEATGNATEAARRAGYKGGESTLRSVGSENLTKPDIITAIKIRVDADPAVKTREQRQRFWTATMDDAAVAMKERLRASELLGKSQGDFVQLHEVNAVSASVVIYHPDNKRGPLGP